MTRDNRGFPGTWLEVWIAPGEYIEIKGQDKLVKTWEAVSYTHLTSFSYIHNISISDYFCEQKYEMKDRKEIGRASCRERV